MIFLLFHSHSQSNFESSASDCSWGWPGLTVFGVCPSLPYHKSLWNLCGDGHQPKLKSWGCTLKLSWGWDYGHAGGTGGKRQFEGPSAASYLLLAYLPPGMGVQPLLLTLDVRWAPHWHPWAHPECWACFILWLPSNRVVTSHIFPVLHQSHLNICPWKLSDGCICDCGQLSI